MFYLKVILIPGAKFEKGRDEDAGYDLYSMIDQVIPPGEGALLPVGIMTEFPPDWVGLIKDRSGMGVKGIMKQGGVIDSGYRGEWGVKLFNSSSNTLEVQSIARHPKAKAIAQVVFVPRGKVEPMFVQTLSESERGENWKGSTDAHNQPKEG